MKTLDEICLQHDADKSSKHHNYARIYEELFAGLRDQPIKILEIGIYAGASMRVWLDAFPKATVVGVDIKDRTGGRLQDERLHLVFGDATQDATWESLATKHGPFDIVIDDGPHRAACSERCMNHLPTILKPSGIMVIEDVYQGYTSHANRDMVDFMAYATMVAHGGGAIRGTMGANWNMATDLAKLIDGIEHRRGLVIIRRVPR